MSLMSGRSLAMICRHGLALLWWESCWMGLGMSDLG